MGKLLPRAALLAVLVASVTAAPQPQDGGRTLPSDAEIENLTQSVLNQPEFQQQATRGWWALVHDLVTTWLREAPIDLHPLSAGFGFFLFVSVLLLTGYALSVLLPELGGGNIVQTLGGLKGRPSAWRSLEGAAGSWEEAMLKARRALADGRLYDSIWIAHRALLSLLDQRRLVDFAKWKTNLDYLQECPADDAAYPLFETVSHAYDLVVYAHRSISVERMAELFNEIESARRNEGE